jgi:hypothetical protein
MMQQQKRIIGQTRDAGYHIGVRRTFPITHDAAWQLLTSAEGIRIWLMVALDRIERLIG